LHRRTALTGATPTAENMDNLFYTYQANNNKLDNVEDRGTNPTTAATDLETQAGGNYTYDATGNLTNDVATNGNTGGITWTPLNKVAQVTKTGGITITYTYDATGKCILKTVDAPGTADDKSTSYVYDAAGQQLLAVYEKSRLLNSTIWSPPILKEAPIYGASRLGMMLPNEDRGDADPNQTTFTRTLEKKNYELTDHLGNVRSVITDMKLPDGNDGFLPEATTRNYYYPFGMERPLMTASTGTQSYRYGYNGMEKDNAVSPTGVTGANYSTDFREIDTRIGRWWSRDPIVKPWESPYVTFGDNPIAFADPSGLDPVGGGENAHTPADCSEDRGGGGYTKPTIESFDKSGGKWIEVTAQKDLSPNYSQSDLNNIRYGDMWYDNGYWHTLSYNRDLERLSVLTYNKYGSWQESIPETTAERDARHVSVNPIKAMGVLLGTAVVASAAIYTLAVYAPVIIPVLAKASPVGAAVGGSIELGLQLVSGEELNLPKIAGATASGAIMGGFTKAAIYAPNIYWSLGYGTLGGATSTTADRFISGESFSLTETLLGTGVGMLGGFTANRTMNYIRLANQYSLPLGGLFEMKLPSIFGRADQMVSSAVGGAYKSEVKSILKLSE
jgi:RHS repeat-associated protein